MDLYPQIYAWENLQLAYQKASRGKRGKAGVASFEYLLADHLLELQQELRQQRYQPGSHVNFTIHEPKRRLISAAPFRDRVVHHALCNVTVPFFEQRFIPDSFANRPGKGTHRALDRCQQFARCNRYVLQCDVVQFFPAVDHEVLLTTLQKMLPPSEGLFWLIRQVLDVRPASLSNEYDPVYFAGDDLFAALRPRGLPIGNLTSQWWANCYLNPFDQFVKRELRCRAYQRYVDDFLLFGNDKVQLWAWRAALVEWLSRLRLTIHAGLSHPRPVTEGFPFLGFTMFPDHRRLIRRKGIAFQRKLINLTRVESYDQVKTSVQGWINHVRYGDTYGLRRAILARAGLLEGDPTHGG